MAMDPAFQCTDSSVVPSAMLGLATRELIYRPRSNCLRSAIVLSFAPCNCNYRIAVAGMETLSPDALLQRDSIRGNHFCMSDFAAGLLVDLNARNNLGCAISVSQAFVVDLRNYCCYYYYFDYYCLDSECHFAEMAIVEYGYEFPDQEFAVLLVMNVGHGVEGEESNIHAVTH